MSGISDRTALKRYLEKNKEFIDTIHQNEELSFTPMKVREFNDKGRSWPIYKSPAYRCFELPAKQSSEYRLIIVNGQLAYARKSNHWGKFRARSKTRIINEHEREEQGYFFEPEYDWNYHNWTLKDSNNDLKKSQAGYILLADLLGKPVNLQDLLDEA